MKKMRMTQSRLTAALLLTVATTCAAQPAPSAEDIFTTAVAVWHMADLKDAVGKNDLTMVGNVAVGKKLEGKDLQESLACGNDGVVAQFDGGYLDAGQGADGALNLTGSAADRQRPAASPLRRLGNAALQQARRPRPAGLQSLFAVVGNWLRTGDPG